jgi:hypothetical protein
MGEEQLKRILKASLIAGVSPDDMVFWNTV